MWCMRARPESHPRPLHVILCRGAPHGDKGKVFRPAFVEIARPGGIRSLTCPEAAIFFASGTFYTDQQEYIETQCMFLAVCPPSELQTLPPQAACG